jgi:hypothetical protein
MYSCRWIPMFRRNMTSPSSGWKSASSDFIRDRGVNIFLQNVSIRPYTARCINSHNHNASLYYWYKILRFLTELQLKRQHNHSHSTLTIKNYAGSKMVCKRIFSSVYNGQEVTVIDLPNDAFCWNCNIQPKPDRCSKETKNVAKFKIVF